MSGETGEQSQPSSAEESPGVALQDLIDEEPLSTGFRGGFRALLAGGFSADGALVAVGSRDLSVFDPGVGGGAETAATHLTGGREG